MPAPTSGSEFLELVRKSGVVDEKRLDGYVQKFHSPQALPTEPKTLAGMMVRDGIITHFQAEQFLLGRWRRFTLGKYKVLERIGQGGMGTVFLCEHKVMRRRAAVKVLPIAKAADPLSLDRFNREARVVASLDHPNIVRAYDIDQEDDLHFLVMEYVDGSSMQEIVKKTGPMSIRRACHYIRQAAIGLQHAHEVAGIVHRDIKPSNLLVDRSGTVKVLDMGLARFFHDEDDVLTKKYDDAVLGTADYLAPEQALDSHGVDIRADIYSLGATFYFLLTGSAPFKEGSVAQKLIWHQTRTPRPIRAERPEVPENLAAIITRMMAKSPAERYQTPGEVAAALSPWTTMPIPPPPEKEMPRLCPAVQGNSFPVPDSSAGSTTPTVAPSSTLRPGARSDRQAPLTAPAAVDVSPSPPLATPIAEPFAVPTASVVAVATPSPNQDEDSLLWQRLPTAPEYVRRPAKMARLPRPSLASWLSRRVRIIAAASGALVAVVVFAVILWPHHGATIPKDSATGVLFVQNGGGPGTFPTLQAAIDHSRPGDRILVRDAQIEECVRVSDGHGESVTVEPATPDLHVVWSCPPNPPEGVLLMFEGASHFRLHGFILDGKQHVGDLVAISGRCRDLTLEDNVCQGFDQTALAFSEAQAKPGDLAIHLVGLRIIAPSTGKADSALRFSGGLSENIVAENCRFEGPLKAAIRVAGQIAHVEVRDSRFFKTTAGLIYQMETPRYGIDLRLVGNTFYDVATALLFEARPLPDARNRVQVQRNLFLRTGQLIRVNNDRPDPALMKKLLNGSADNVRDPQTKAEPLLPTDVATQPVPVGVDSHVDRTFLRYPPGSPFAQARRNRPVVGVPQS